MHNTPNFGAIYLTILITAIGIGCDGGDTSSNSLGSLLTQSEGGTSGDDTSTPPAGNNPPPPTSGDNQNDDSDNDGLTNAEEAIHGTDPLNPDSDGDTLLDGAEINTHLTNPLNKNSDDDDEDDDFEVINPSFRNPNNPDDDGDGYDGTKAAKGAYGANVVDDCDNNNAYINPDMADQVDTIDRNCRPDKTADMREIFLMNSSSVHYRVQANTLNKATTLHVDADQVTITGSLYECEEDVTLSNGYACSTWANPPWYMQGISIGFNVIQHGPRTWQVEVRARNCFSTSCGAGGGTPPTTDYATMMLGE